MATSYTLQEQVNGGGWTTVQANGNTSWSTSGRGNGTYGYQVQSCNGGGCAQWSGTSTVSVALIPVAPGTPLVSSSGTTRKPVVTVSWGAVTGATTYTVEETDPESTVSTFYSGSATTASQLILQTGSVKFRVKACNTAGCSAWSGYGSIMLQSGL